MEATAEVRCIVHKCGRTIRRRRPASILFDRRRSLASRRARAFHRSSYGESSNVSSAHLHRSWSLGSRRTFFRRETVRDGVAGQNISATLRSSSASQFCRSGALCVEGLAGRPMVVRSHRVKLLQKNIFVSDDVKFSAFSLTRVCPSDRSRRARSA